MKTKRLIIKPMNDASLEALLKSQTDDELIKAYNDMLTGSRTDPGARLWYTAWNISLQSGERVGDICFKGPPNGLGEVEIGYGILDEFQGQGYATEAVNAICSWGFSMPGCYFIRAQAEEDNRAAERVMEKCGFKRIGDGSEGTLWEKVRPQSATIPAFMCFGMTVGFATGVISQNFALWICIGLIIGTTVGVALDIKDRKMRKRLPKAPPEK